MERREMLLKNFREFYEEAVDALSKGRFTSSYILLFKALTAAADAIILESRGLIPKNHRQRFELLPYIEPELALRLSESFEEYTKAYSMSLKEEAVLELKMVVEEYGRKIKALE